MLLLSCRWIILCHHSYQLVGNIGFLEVGGLFRRQLELDRLRRPFDVVELGRPDHRRRHLCSSQASDTSVIETPRFSASSATRLMITASCPAVASYLNFA